MFSRVSLIVVVCVVGALSAPHQICSPNQWQGVMLGKIAQVVNGSPQVLVTSAMSYTDHQKNMESFIQNVTIASTVTMIKTVTDFNKLKTYEIHPKEMKCVVRDLPADSKMPRYCEDELHRLESFSLGGKMADIYRVTFHNTTMDITLMRDNMSPVSAVLEQNYMGIPQMIAFQIGNVSDMITDTGVFDVPSYCMTPAKQTKRVCAPDQFENMGFGKVAQVPAGTPMVLDLVMKTSRDYKNKIESYIVDALYNGVEYPSQTITDYNKKMMYNIDLKSKTCRTSPTLTDTMLDYCSDSDMLQYVTSLTVDGKVADVYDIINVKSVINTVTVFRDSFETISAVTEQNVINIPQMLAFQFGNMTVGIKNRDVFKVPDYCNKEADDVVV